MHMQQDSTVQPPQSGARRVAWVDIARVYAAIIIIANHLNLFSPDLYRTLWAQFLFARTPFFLILAAYFVGRGAFGTFRLNQLFLIKRARFLFYPYLLWCTAALVLTGTSPHTPHVETFAPFFAWLHGGSLPWTDAFKALAKCYGLGGHPVDAPLWFLRDIILFTFIAPLLMRLGKYVLPVGLVLLSFNFFAQGDLGHDWPTPDSLGFFCLGLFLSRHSLDELHAIIRPVAAFFAAVLIPLTVWLILNRDQHSIILVMIGLVSLISVAMLTEDHLPRIGKWLAQLAPAGFLVFGAHHIIIILLQDSGWISCKGWLWDVTWLVLVPAIYAIICAVFFLIRKYAPALLPYVAGYRVKPAQRA
jgi:hypothetical protein